MAGASAGMLGPLPANVRLAPSLGLPDREVPEMLALASAGAVTAAPLPPMSRTKPTARMEMISARRCAGARSVSGDLRVAGM